MWFSFSNFCLQFIETFAQWLVFRFSMIRCIDAATGSPHQKVLEIKSSTIATLNFDGNRVTTDTFFFHSLLLYNWRQCIRSTTTATTIKQTTKQIEFNIECWNGMLANSRFSFSPISFAIFRCDLFFSSFFDCIANNKPFDKQY